VIAALLIGRKGSTGFPGKNTFPILGRSMCLYPMLAALNSKYIDRVYVSTDDEKIIDIANQKGVGVIHRPPELCTKDALGEDAFVHGYRVIREIWLEEQIASGIWRTENIEMVVLLMANAVTILAKTIDIGISVLDKYPGLDSAVTVSRYNMWSPLRARKIEPIGLSDIDGLKPFIPFEAFGDPAILNCDRDSQGDVWFADMGVSIVRPHCLENMENGLLPQKWMGRNIYPLKQEGGCDIDYEWQAPGVEHWLLKRGFGFIKTPYDEE